MSKEKTSSLNFQWKLYVYSQILTEPNWVSALDLKLGAKSKFLDHLKILNLIFSLATTEASLRKMYVIYISKIHYHEYLF